MLKRKILHILLVIIAVNAAGWQQVYRLPVLVAHFFEHYRVKGGTDVIDFLAEHYSGEEPNHTDSRHDQLPFKKHQDESVTFMFISSQVDVLRVFPKVSTLFISFYRTSLCSIPGPSLFRPPCLS